MYSFASSVAIMTNNGKISPPNLANRWQLVIKGFDEANN